MFNNIALDVFIGLIFIFLLYSLLATILQEMIARAFNLRARMLQKSLRKMLEDNSNRSNPDAYEPWWKRITLITFVYDSAVSLVRFFYPTWKRETFIKRFYNHPSIKYLGENYTSSKPSYLHAQNFSQTIIQLLRGDNYDGRNESESEAIRTNLENNSLRISRESLKQIRNLFYDARQDSLVFKVKLENWFNEMQDRTNGWYKKQTQVILILTGFWIAWLFNVDTIAIYKILATDKDARDNLVQMAIENKDRYKQAVLLVDSLQVSKPQQTNDTVVVQQIPDTLLQNTYNMVAGDAEKANEILGLGTPWKDTCELCKDSAAVIAAVKDSLEYVNTLSTQLKAQQAELVKMDKSLTNVQKRKVAAGKDGIKGQADIDTFTKQRDSIAAVLRTTKNDVDSWKRKQQLAARCEYITDELSKHSFKYSPRQEGGATTFFGWVLTALAISLGAPFWFDFLNKFIQLRGTGPKPLASTDTTVTTITTTDPLTTPDGNTIRG